LIFLGKKRECAPAKPDLEPELEKVLAIKEPDVSSVHHFI